MGHRRAVVREEDRVGREVRRVPIGFDWPLGKTWAGFLNPYADMVSECCACGGCGYNPETRAIGDAWYSFGDRGKRWCHDITQDEVDALVEAGRLHDFTHNFRRGIGWVPKDPTHHPTAAEVNKWSRHPLGHDDINKWICVRTRATRLGVYGNCPECGGAGGRWLCEAGRALYDEWKPTPPPRGEGWQIWETVGDGSPITPALATPEELAAWCVANHPWGQVADHATWLAFISFGSAPSFVADAAHGFRSGVEVFADGRK